MIPWMEFWNAPFFGIAPLDDPLDEILECPFFSFAPLDTPLDILERPGYSGMPLFDF